MPCARARPAASAKAPDGDRVRLRAQPDVPEALDRHKVKPEQIRTMDDFVKRLPFIDKKEILDAQAVSPPFGDALAIHEDFFHQRFATSGSTGAPLHIPLTYHSAELCGRVVGLPVLGRRASGAPHAFYFPFNWGIFAAFWSAYMGRAPSRRCRRLRAAGSTAKRAAPSARAIPSGRHAGDADLCALPRRDRARDRCGPRQDVDLDRDRVR